jgi:hypothetical protein
MFNDVETGREIGDVAESVLADEDVGRVQGDRPVRPRQELLSRRFSMTVQQNA